MKKSGKLEEKAKRDLEGINDNSGTIEDVVSDEERMMKLNFRRKMFKNYPNMRL